MFGYGGLQIPRRIRKATRPPKGELLVTSILFGLRGFVRKEQKWGGIGFSHVGIIKKASIGEKEESHMPLLFLAKSGEIW